MATDQPYVVVHGGVHKTATSYIQGMLQRNSGKLRKRGVHYVNHRKTRLNYTIHAQANGYEKLNMDMRQKVSDEELLDIARTFFDEINAEPGDRIVLSDENMTGHAGHCVRRGRPYHFGHVLIPVFANAIPYTVTEVHLALRNYADFFASIYVEFIRSARGDNLIFEEVMKRNVLSKLPSWMRTIGHILDAFPDAQIIIWRHEDFRNLSDRIIRGLCGPDMQDIKFDTPKRKRGRPSASHRAVQEFQAEVARHGGDTAIARRVEIQDAYPRGPDYPGYDPWSSSERQHLVRLYEKDVMEISRLDRVTLIEC